MLENGIKITSSLHQSIDMVLLKNQSYFDNLREVVKSAVKHNLLRLRARVDQDSWEEHQVNTFEQFWVLMARLKSIQID